MKPFLLGKRPHTSAALRSMHSHPCLPAVGHVTPAPAASGPSPTVEVVKEGDKVVRLIITCSCGEHIEVDCLYPAGS